VSKVSYIGLGSNLNNPIKQIQTAFAELKHLPKSKLVRSSSLYQSPFMGNSEQADVINAVVALQTELSPYELLELLKSLEKQHGRLRQRDARFSARTLDLDILLYHDLILNEPPQLVIPHPQMHLRNFVITPLYEISPSLVLPNGALVKDLIAELDNMNIVKVKV